MSDFNIEVDVDLSKELSRRHVILLTQGTRLSRSEACNESTTASPEHYLYNS
jgi:hypothetical protein